MNKKTEEDKQIQKINVEDLRKGGVVQLKGKDIFSVWVKTSCSNLNSKQLKKIADITDKYGKGFLLFSTRQIPIIPFINLKDVSAVKKELEEVYLELDRCGPRVRNINVCYEDNICPEAVTNSISLAEKLDNFFRDPILHKIKIGVVGCKKDCIISRVLTDIAFIGNEKNDKERYDVYLGGKLGVNPFIGVKLAENLSENESIKFVQNYFDLIKKEGKSGERGADLIKRLGIDRVKQELNKNLQEDTSYETIECKTALKNNKQYDKIILKIRATCGEVTSTQLRKIAYVAEKHGQKIVHFAVRGSPEIPGIDKKNVEDIRKELSLVDLQILDRGIDNIQSCFGSYCIKSRADPQSLIKKVEGLIENLDLNNENIKISASGCPNSCGISHLNDIGFLGVVEPEIVIEKCPGCGLCATICKRNAIKIKNNIAVIDKEKCAHCGECIDVCTYDAIIEKNKGIAVLVGGRGGEEPRLGQIIAEFLSEDDALRVTENCLKLLKERNVSAFTIIDEIGIEKFKEKILEEKTT